MLTNRDTFGITVIILDNFLITMGFAHLGQHRVIQITFEKLPRSQKFFFLKGHGRWVARSIIIYIWSNTTADIQRNDMIFTLCSINGRF